MFRIPRSALHAFLWLALPACPAVWPVQEAEAPEPAPAAEPAGELTELASGVYANLAAPDSEEVSNSGVIVLAEAVLVFDTHFTSAAGARLARRIQAVTSRPVRYVVLSHYHPDHTHGGQAFPEAEQIIGSTSARRDMLQRDLPAMHRAVESAEAQLKKMRRDLLQAKDAAQQEDLRRQIRAREALLDNITKRKVSVPVLTVEDRLVLHEGSRRIELIASGGGHTEGDLILFLPDERIVFTGDLFFNGALPNSQDAGMLEWMKSLGALLQLEADKFVPGHGPVGSREDVQKFLGYFEELKRMVDEGVKRGDGLDQILNDCRVPAAYEDAQFQGFFPANVQRMYAELRALQAAEPPAEPQATTAPPVEKRRP